MVLDAAKSGLLVRDIVNSLCRSFPEVPETEIRRDVEEVLRGFVEAGLLADEERTLS